MSKGCDTASAIARCPNSTISHLKPVRKKLGIFIRFRLTTNQYNVNDLQGYLVVISTKMSEVGEEKFSGLFHKDGLTDVAYSAVLQHAVVAGSSGIKVRLQWPWYRSCQYHC